MDRSNTMSLTVMVIILAMLGLFIGYLLGNWFIQLVTGEPTPSQQVVDNKVVEEEIVVEDNEKDTSTYFGVDSSTEFEQQEVKEQLSGEVFVIQVGAFSSYDNALSLKEELANKGYQATITEGAPFKVQLGATNDRKSAEETKKKIEALGYEAFIAH